VEADPSQLEQVLVNLLVNAREAMPRGGRVTVETRNEHVDAGEARRRGVAAGDYAVLAVRDQGSGIEETVREKIFDPFFSTKQRGAHSGLGLATVYGIVQGSGGFLRLESRMGRGTTFHVYLPRTRRRPDPGEAPSPAAVAALRHRGRVLVVEDNADLRRVSTAVLVAVGHEVESAADGDEGLRLLDHGAAPFDVVITDLVMPGSSGRTVAERALALDARTRVVLVSGFRDRVRVEDLLSDERVRYLDKPFAPDRLLSTLEEMLGDLRSGAAAPRPAGGGGTEGEGAAEGGDGGA
jgi:CheY-like chemotaxis protein